MHPFSHGDSLRVRRRRLYWPGDVVVVRSRDCWISHRFLGYALGRRGLIVLTQADSSRHADPAARVNRVAGRVDCQVSRSDRALAVRRYGRALLQRLRRLTH